MLNYLVITRRLCLYNISSTIKELSLQTFNRRRFNDVSMTPVLDSEGPIQLD